MKVGVIGNGGREHALCSSLKNSDKINRFAPPKRDVAQSG